MSVRDFGLRAYLNGAQVRINRPAKVCQAGVV